MDESVYKLLGVTPNQRLKREEIAERSVLMMLNEAALCLDEGVIRNARDGDIGAIFGIGFPPFLGGPFRYMDTLGIKHVVSRLEHYQQTLGEKYTPAHNFDENGRRRHYLLLITFSQNVIKLLKIRACPGFFVFISIIPSQRLYKLYNSRPKFIANSSF